MEELEAVKHSYGRAALKRINRNFGGARVLSFIALAVNLREAVEEKGHLSNTSL